MTKEILEKSYKMLYKSNSNTSFFNFLEEEVKDEDLILLILNYFLTSDNDYTRYKLLLNVLSNPSSIDKYGIDIISSTMYKTRFMSVDLISKLAVTALKLNRIDIFKSLKEFIFTNYDKNNLAQNLLVDNSYTNKYSTYSLLEYELISDIDRYLKTSKDTTYRLIYEYYDYFSEENKAKYDLFYHFFANETNNQAIINIIKSGLLDELLDLINDYLNKSQSKLIYYIDHGGTTYSYRVGDYVIKLSYRKFSYEDYFTSNTYHFIKNEYEKYIRDKNNHVYAAIEVQKYLDPKEFYVDPEGINNWLKSLDELGYIYLDGLISNSGNNVGLLASYLDANSSDPESLPEWFKEYPLVVFDHDLVYKKNIKVHERKINYIKCLH